MDIADAGRHMCSLAPAIAIKLNGGDLAEKIGKIHALTEFPRDSGALRSTLTAG